MNYLCECERNYRDDFLTEIKKSKNEKFELNKLKIFNIEIKGGINYAPELLNTIPDIDMNVGQSVTYKLPEFADYGTHPDLSDNIGDLSDNIL